MHERIRKVFLDRWARLVTTRPIIVLAVSLLLAGMCVAAAWRWMEFRPDRSDLVDAELAWNQRYFQHKSQFPRWNDLIVALEGDADDPAVDALARAVAESLRGDNRVLAADAGYNAADASPRLFRIAPEPQFDQSLDELRELHHLLHRAPHANAALAMMTSRLRTAGADEPNNVQRLGRLRQILRPYLEAIFDNDVRFDMLSVDRDEWVPLRSNSGRIRFVRVQFAEHEGTIDDVSANIRWLREQIASMVSASDRPNLAWGVTGLPAIEADETAQSIRDSTVASILAFALITALLVIVYRGVAVPLVAAFTLLIGIAWSFGWLMLAVGHLQLLSVVFAVILLGLGIDFAVHIIARLELLRDAFDDLPTAMSRVLQGVGPGMVTGAMTTAAAFGVTALTRFRGMAEMGIIAAGGILLCLLASFTVLPALLQVLGWKRLIRHRHGGEQAHFAHGRLDHVDRRPGIALAVAAVAIIAMVWPATRVQYDPNVLKLHPPGIESVQWERRVVADDSRSAWGAIVHTDAAGAPGLVTAMRALPEVSDVGAMGTLFPPDQTQREQAIAAVRQADVPPIDSDDGPQAMINQLQLVQRGLRAALDVRNPDPRVRSLVSDINLAMQNWRAFDDAERTARHQRVEDAYQRAREPMLALLDAALSPGPLTGDDLPPLLRELWIGRDGRWQLQVYPAIDPQQRSVLHPDRLGAFVSAVRTVAPEALGPPVQIYESSELIKREYLRAALFAIVAVLIILLLDFQSLADAVAAILPVAIGFLGAFAMLGAIGMPLNFANIIVMPLIFGIGVDAGVHMVHRWRIEPLGRPAGLSGATGRGITLTMLTTIIGFGCMLTAEHRGIRSLGLVMVTGLFVTLVSCWFVLPAVLRLRTSRDLIDHHDRNDDHADETPGTVA